MRHMISRCVVIGLILGGSSFAPLQADEAKNPLPALSLGADALSSEGLADLRGGAEVVVNNQALDGLVRDNQAYNLTTGGNLISEGAFAGSSGLSTVIQNSGNNVLIQNSTILNVQFK